MKINLNVKAGREKVQPFRKPEWWQTKDMHHKLVFIGLYEIMFAMSRQIQESQWYLKKKGKEKMINWV